jgi:1,2-diacylglycerol 3-beta-galactosyltransferase
MKNPSEPLPETTSDDRPKRVLILSADAGFGHRAAANAIAGAFEMNYPGRADVTIVNPLDHTEAPGLLVSAQDDYDRIIQQAPEVYRVGYGASDGAIPAGIAEQALAVMLFSVLRDILSTHQPDVVITTYPLYQAGLATILALSRKAAPFLTVVTDLASVHRLWFNESAAMCLVPTDAVAQKAFDSGMRRDRVEITGLPVDPRLGLPVDKAVLREKLGWRNDRVVGLFTGSKRVKKLEPVAQILNHSGLPLELAIIAGGDENLRGRFEAIEWHQPAHVYGFVDNMVEMMQAADFIVCKAGGLIVSEALAAGLPLLIAEALPGQETGNVDYVVRGQAGLFVNDAGEALVQVYHWLDNDRAELKVAGERARAIGRPEAAARVAERGLEVANRGPQPAPRGLASQLPRLRELLGVSTGDG